MLQINTTQKKSYLKGNAVTTVTKVGGLTVLQTTYRSPYTTKTYVNSKIVL